MEYAQLKIESCTERFQCGTQTIHWHMIEFRAHSRCAYLSSASVCVCVCKVFQTQVVFQHISASHVGPTYSIHATSAQLKLHKLCL